MRRVRVSIANLGPTLTVPAGETDSRHCVAILNSGSFKKGKKLWQPIGGAVEVTKIGRNFLEDYFHATDFHRSPEGGTDARFHVDEFEVDGVFQFFQAQNPKHYETDIRREVVKELSESEFLENEFFREIPPVLTREEAVQIVPRYRACVVQPFSDASGESPLAEPGIPSRRMFHYFDLEIPTREMFAKILTSRAIRELSPDEYNLTEGGRHKGLTRDGETVADNFINY